MTVANVMLSNWKAKFVFGLLLFTFFLSCKEGQEVDVIVEDNLIFPVINEIKVEDVLYVDRIECYDSSCVVINRKMTPCIHLYNRFDFTFQGALGDSGHGPTDFLFPFFLYPSSDVNCLSLYDVNLGAFKNVDLEKFLSRKMNVIESKPMPHDLIGSPNMFITSDSTYIGNKDNGNGLFFMKRGDSELEWVDFPSSIILPETDFTVMNMNRITVNSQRNKVAVGMSYYNKVFLYDFNRNLLKGILVGEDKVFPRLVDDYCLSEDNYLFCKEIKSTDSNIYLLIQRIKEQDMSNPGKSTSTILVLDWNLDYTATYQLPHYIMAFTIDMLTNRIIYAGMNMEGGSDLYYFDIVEDCL